MAEEKKIEEPLREIDFRMFESEEDLTTIISMIEKELSEPYPIYTYRYFVQKWPELTELAYFKDDPEKKCIGCVVSKLEPHIKQSEGTNKLRGYIAMLAVDPNHRRLGLGRTLVVRTMDLMKEKGVEEIVLETEITNIAALKLYESFGFVKEKRLQQYYLNGNDAYKLKLYVK